VGKKNIVRSDVLIVSVSAGGSVEGMSCRGWEAIRSTGQEVGWLNWRSLKICERRKKTAKTYMGQ